MKAFTLENQRHCIKIMGTDFGKEFNLRGQSSLWGAYLEAQQNVIK